MLGNIAHQWRQPLSVITTVATGMKLQKEFENLDDKTFDEAIENITNSALYLSKTIDDFRSFFKSDKKETFFSIKETFEKVLKLTNSQFKNHEITIIKEINDFQIYGFENEFIQVLINILNNSKDALINKKENKLIFIKTFEDDENNFVIKIKDNGGGIENKILDKVCEPYFTTKHQSTGTGIGLYMAEEIIEKHMNGILEINNCKFSYENEEYVGAEVTILLNKEN
jgi:signal transduction histidine kinase